MHIDKNKNIYRYILIYFSDYLFYVHLPFLISLTLYLPHFILYFLNPSFGKTHIVLDHPSYKSTYNVYLNYFILFWLHGYVNVMNLLMKWIFWHSIFLWLKTFFFYQGLPSLLVFSILLEVLYIFTYIFHCFYVGILIFLTYFQLLQLMNYSPVSRLKSFPERK